MRVGLKASWHFGKKVRRNEKAFPFFFLFFLLFFGSYERTRVMGVVQHGRERLGLTKQ